jgi:hypothetical protein
MSVEHGWAKPGEATREAGHPKGPFESERQRSNRQRGHVELGRPANERLDSGQIVMEQGGSPAVGVEVPQQKRERVLGAAELTAVGEVEDGLGRHESGDGSARRAANAPTQ